MRLVDFIAANMEPILAEWEGFARDIWPGHAADPATLRDHAGAILLATVSDMHASQTPSQQSDKSKGHGSGTAASAGLDKASVSHAVGRVVSGFDLDSVVAEYRALRASVLRLWHDSGPTPDLSDIDDLTRFNESIDQSLTEAVRGFMQHIERERGALLANEQAARKEAEAANQAKDLFLATLSHEMRTPLNAIAGWTSILRIKRAQEDLDEGLDVIERNTRAQIRLIEDILDVSRIVSGKLRVDIRPCELTEVINEAVDAVRPAAEARRIELDVQLDWAASAVSCDAVRLQQVVWNLVSNAVKFTPKGGRVSVTLARDGSSVRIQVSDSGQGIVPELLPYIFERFRQADSGTRRRFGGLGLGLSIVKHIVEQHGGTVEAMSPGVGCGATFTVCLPILALRSEKHGQDQYAARKAGEWTPEEGQARPDPLRLVRLDGLRVLVVDDEADARRLLVKVMEQAGAIVLAAASAAEALEMLPKFQPHVLVSDLGMPEQDGLDLIRQVRRLGNRPNDLPVVALTAFVRRDEERQALLAGFQVHIAKPADPHDLSSVIARLAAPTD